MPDRSKRKELWGAVLGVSLLLFAMSWRWVFPTLKGISWPLLDRKNLASTSQVSIPPQPLPIPETPETAVIPSAEPPLKMNNPAQLSTAKQKALLDALSAADNAMKTRHWLEPVGNNALDWYVKALSIDPQNAEAMYGKAALLETLFERANAALDDGEIATANELIVALNQRGIADTRAIELSARRDLLAAIGALLQQASERLAAGQEIAPADASALTSFRAVLALDERNRAALIGIGNLQANLLARALSAASDGRFEAAETLLSEATNLVPDGKPLADAQIRISELKDRHVDDLLRRAETALTARDTSTANNLWEQAKALNAPPEALQSIKKLLDNASLYANYQPGESFRDPYQDQTGEGPMLVVIPIGNFLMGSPGNEANHDANESPEHRVQIQRPFAMASTETTLTEFRRFVNDTGHVTVAEKEGWSLYYDEKNGRIAQSKGIDWRNDYVGGKARVSDPIIHVAWRDAAAYAAWLTEKTGFNYRLPSEAEYEYVLRAGTQTAYPWGTGNPDEIVGNLTGDGDRSRQKRKWDKAFKRYRDGFWGPAPVAQFDANALGIFDLIGNVSEWVEDCWHENYRRAPSTGEAWVNQGCNSRVVRGSSWGSAPEQSRSAFRTNASEDTRSPRIGFRVVRNL